MSIADVANSMLEEEDLDDLSQFHITNRKGTITGVYDFGIFEYLKKEKHIMYVGEFPYLYSNGVYVRDDNGRRLKTEIMKLISTDFIRSTTVDRIYRLFLQDAELAVSSDALNNHPRHWINFQNGMYDLIEKKMLPHDPKYLSMNQIPHRYDRNAILSGDNVEAWLSYALPDQNDREMFLEYVGYCMTVDTRQQKFLIFKGEGGTGKSVFLSMVKKVIGSENTSHLGMEKISEKFQASALLGKLLNVCGDLKTQAVPDVTILKQATGEDSIMIEAKGKDPVPVNLYCKHLYSTNELPTILNERTNGFFRRCLILPIDRKPQTVRPDFLDTLETDYFIHLAVDAARRMYERGMILESDHSKEAVKQYRRDSDSIQAFLEERAKCLDGVKTERGLLYEAFEKYCAEEGRKALEKKNFFKGLRDKGFSETKSGNYRYFQGISID